MGAQSSLLSLVSSVTGATGNTISGVKKLQGQNVDSQMADYARQMRDAKLKTAKNNMKLSKIRLQKINKTMEGDK
ncbi:MAG: hypothetical protein J6W64_04695 [Bacilli bacterium]|nr:hypothetical protein [Bacilli bacterium]